MGMVVKAATITVDAHVDIDSMAPDLRVDVQLEEAFGFLGSKPEVLAAWLRGVADRLEAR